jgi:hypothetical protein
MSTRDEENGMDGYNAIQDELGRRINGIGVRMREIWIF